MDTFKKVTPSLEDYLEKILVLSKKTDLVRTTDIAKEMKISKPSVNKAINILKSKQLVFHEHYKSISLTDKGLIIAENVEKNHKILKRFLKELLGVPEEIAEYEACLIEHSICNETVEKLSNYLNNVLK